MNSVSGDPDTASAMPFPLPAEELLPLIYGELRRLAAQRMAAEPAGLTLQATALVHEPWLRRERKKKAWENRAQFFAAAAEAMRRILIEQARRRAAAKRGGGGDRTDLSDSIIAVTASD